MSEEVKLVPIDQVIPNDILRINYKDEDIKWIAENYESSDKIVPPIVREVDGKFQLITGQEIYEAFKLRSEETIPVIKRDISEDEAWVFAVNELLNKPEISSIDRENIFYNLRKSGKFKSDADLSRKLGGKPTPQRIGNLVDAKVIRDEIKKEHNSNVAFASSEFLIAIKNLPLPEKWEFLQLVEKGKIPAGQIREVVNFYNACPQTLKKSILKGKTNLENAIQKYKELVEGLTKSYGALKKLFEKKESIKKRRHFTSDLFVNLSNLIKKIDSTYINNIKHEMDKKQAIDSIKDSIALLSRLLYKLQKLNEKSYQSVLKIFDVDSETIEDMVEQSDYDSLGEDD